MNRTLFRTVTVLAAAVVLGGCEDTLTVTNPNSGDSNKVLATPTDLENLLGGYFKRWHSGVYGSIASLEAPASNMALMSYSSLANNCLNNHTPFTGATNFNEPGNTCSNEQSRMFYILAEVNKVASIALSKLDGGLVMNSPAETARARAFAEFLSGISIGYVAMMYDSLAIADATTAGDEITPLVGYDVAATEAYAALQRAIDAANSQAISIPQEWYPTTTTLNSANFIRLVRSYRARIRANMARTPAERAAVDWPLVIADAQNGITADHEVITNTISGPTHGGWRNQWGVRGLWHQMPPWYIGMADNSGSYQTWLNTPLGDRGAGNNGFFMTTVDTRFPQGATRAAQIADFQKTSCSAAATTCARYFENRAAGLDEYAGAGFGWSNYDWVRAQSWRTAGAAGSARNGPITDIDIEEMWLLEAEGHYRAGAFALAGALVNQSRARGGLPAIVTFDATTPVPGGVNCVPKVSLAGAALTCGTLFEALKYEKRIETMFQHYAALYLDSRGWGDLPVGTPTYWATPFEELLARRRPQSDIYGTGDGPGMAPGSFATSSTYGW